MRSLRFKTVLRRSLWALHLRKKPQWPISSSNWEEVFRSYQNVDAYKNIAMGVDPAVTDTSTYDIITTIEDRRRYEEAALKRIKEELDGKPTKI